MSFKATNFRLSLQFRWLRLPIDTEPVQMSDELPLCSSQLEHTRMYLGSLILIKPPSNFRPDI